jgi:hypothetical protein
MRNVVIDLETGDTEVLPLNWAQDKIEKALLYAEMAGQPLHCAAARMVERVQWTDIAGDSSCTTRHRCTTASRLPDTSRISAAA